MARARRWVGVREAIGAGGESGLLRGRQSSQDAFECAAHFRWRSFHASKEGGLTVAASHVRRGWTEGEARRCKREMRTSTGETAGEETRARQKESAREEERAMLWDEKREKWREGKRE
eukprot:4477200-Pleurochrysis_carterae.AAC.1